MKYLLLTVSVMFLLLSPTCVAQEIDDKEILKSILSHYYKSEKVIVKGRNQLLFTYCDKVNNNEEIYETVNHLKLPPDLSRFIKSKVTADTAAKTWTSELEQITVESPNLMVKVNACLSLEEYHQKQKRFNLNNQRLMIVSKPIYYPDGKTALVKVVFYRTIEHNSGSVLLMTKADGKWIIKEFLNSWST